MCGFIWGLVFRVLRSRVFGLGVWGWVSSVLGFGAWQGPCAQIQRVLGPKYYTSNGTRCVPACGHLDPTLGLASRECEATDLSSGSCADAVLHEVCDCRLGTAQSP